MKTTFCKTGFPLLPDLKTECIKNDIHFVNENWSIYKRSLFITIGALPRPNYKEISVISTYLVNFLQFEGIVRILVYLGPG